MRAITENKTRNSIDELFEKAFTGRQTWAASFDMIKSLPGFRVVDETAYPDMRGCDWLVFKDEEWYLPVRSAKVHAFIRELPQILLEYGYQEVSSPKNGDIVAYCTTGDSEIPRGKHFGIYENARVLSKFNEGPVYEHDRDAVPKYYGNGILFFRKRD